MKYYYKVYLWENGYKSTDYTPWVTAPIYIEDKLDETMDTAKIVLDCVPTIPISECPIGNKPFAPKTKFRLERYTSDPNIVDGESQPINILPQKYWDYVVDHDDVDCPTTCPQYCTHHLYLIEASVIAHGMHVDNIALTYELQDVDLNYSTIPNPTGFVVVNFANGGHGL